MYISTFNLDCPYYYDNFFSNVKNNTSNRLFCNNFEAISDHLDLKLFSIASRIAVNLGNMQKYFRNFIIIFFFKKK